MLRGQRSYLSTNFGPQADRSQTSNGMASPSILNDFILVIDKHVKTEIERGMRFHCCSNENMILEPAQHAFVVSSRIDTTLRNPAFTTSDNN